MSLDLDPNKQAPKKLQTTHHTPVYFNQNSVHHAPSQINFAILLDNELNFQEHLNKILSNVNKTNGLLDMLQGIS